MPSLIARLSVATLFLLCCLGTAPVEAGTPAPQGAEVYFIGLEDGDVVPTTFVVRFGLRGMGVAPAGIDVPDTGHHHLLVNVTELPPMDQPLPASEQVVHFGAGQTETELTLSPGTHTLQLLLGDHAHVPHDPPVLSRAITITVSDR